MTTNIETDVAVIGAGIVGCSIALALNRAGLRTHNADVHPAPGYGSTSHSSAIVRPFYSHVTACAVAHQARSHWLDWAGFVGLTDPAGMAQYEECGGLVLLREGDSAAFSGSLDALREVGVPFELLDAEALRKRIPGIDLQAFGPPVAVDDPHFAEPVPGHIEGAVSIAAAGYVNDPQLATHNLYHAASSAGAQFSFRQPVVAIECEGDGVTGVRLGNGTTIKARFVINAAGPFSATVNAMAGVELPITTAAHRHEVATVTRAGVTIDGFIADPDAGVYLRPAGGDVMVGTIDPACDAPDVVSPDDYSDQLSEHWTRNLMRAAQRFPALPIESPARGTVGLYDVSTDWIPIYDKTDLPGFYVAIGTSGNQFKNAPLVGAIMTAILQQELAGIDHDHDAAILSLPDLRQTVDLGFYSRLRDVQATSGVLA